MPRRNVIKELQFGASAKEVRGKKNSCEIVRLPQ